MFSVKVEAVSVSELMCRDPRLGKASPPELRGGFAFISSNHHETKCRDRGECEMEE